MESRISLYAWSVGAEEGGNNSPFESFLTDSTILCQYFNEGGQEEKKEQETREERGLIQHLLPGAKK
jgi:hypothetical protein